MQTIKEQWAEQQQDMLKKVLEWAGDMPTLAKVAAVHPGVVHGWVKRGRISSSAAITIERMSDGLFKKEDIRPDVTEWRK